MGSEWPTVTLAEVCETITDGAHYSPPEDPQGLPMASVKDLTRHGIDIRGCKRISPSDFQTLKRQGCMPSSGDVLIAKDGNSALDTVCVHRIRDEVVLLSSVAILRPNDRIDSDFLRYYLESPQTRAMMKSGYRSGSAIPRVILQDFKRTPVLLPSLPEQRHIARVLVALDDKIELNRRRSQTLESMARALFKSWFVDFDPVRAKAESRDPGLVSDVASLFPDSFEESEVDEIPKGWRTAPIGELARVAGGSTPSTSEATFWDNGCHYWATPKDLSALATPVLFQTERRITDAGLAQIGSGLLPAGTVLLSSRAPIGYIAVAEVPVAINQGFIAMEARDGVSNLFLRQWADSAHDEIVGQANGSTFLEISKSSFRPIRVVLPPEPVMSAFDRTARSLYRRVVASERETHTVAALRDKLLPNLMSGKLRTRTTEATFEVNQ